MKKPWAEQSTDEIIENLKTLFQKETEQEVRWRATNILKLVATWPRDWIQRNCPGLTEEVLQGVFALSARSMSDR